MSRVQSTWRLPLCWAVLFVSAGAAVAQQEPMMGADYPQAMKFSSEFLRQFVYSTAVQPQWIGKTDEFWYEYRTSQGTQYWRVDPLKAQKQSLFDRNKLGALLSEQVRKPLDPAKLPLSRVSLNDEGLKMKFVTDDFQYEYDLKAETLAKLGKAPPASRIPTGGRGERGERFEEFRRQMEERQRQQQQQQQQQERQQEQQEQQQDNERQEEQQQNRRQEFASRFGGDPRVYSPDRKHYVFIKDDNLFLAEAGKEKEAVALSTDCNDEYCFSMISVFGGRQRSENESARPARPSRPMVTWASDSKTFYATRFDTRGIQELFLVDSLGDPRPKLQKYRYPMPGEDAIRKTELFFCNVAKKNLVRVTPKWKHESYSNLTWMKNGEELRFIRTDRLLRNLEFCSLNTSTGEQKPLIAEGFENATVTYQPARSLDDTDEMIWWSERTGWGHFYLYEKSTGKLKNQITSGPFRASRIIAVDTKQRVLWFRGNARESGENVYYEHLYRVRLDGTDLTLLDAGDANHSSTLSPTREFHVDNWSRMDQGPISVLRNGKGQIVMELEKTDLSRLYETGWKLPETFMVKAADGVTDLYGNMWKPYSFDPKKKYPIIAHVYPGPQTEGVQHTFSPINGNQQLAQLGFIVIQVGHRGGTPTRSKAYHSYGYFNLRDYGLADKKSAIEQLAARHPFIDIDRVGIYGHSGGGFMSAAALLQKPYNEFFKAAVASAGNHDNNIYNNLWAERYHGLKEVAVKKEEDKKTTEVQTGTGTGERRGTRRTRGSGAEGDDPFLDDTEKKKEAKEDKTRADAAKKDDKATTEKKATQTKAADAKKADVKKTDEKKATDAKATTEKKATETKAADAKKTEEKKATDAKTADKKTDEKKDQTVKKDEKKDAPPETKFEIKVPTNAELAENLKGAILLVHGEIDNNVHPANTMRLVDALIKANKRFDMLILPGQRHGFGAYTQYFNQRMWDFFALHLLDHRQNSADILEKTPRK